MPLILTATLAIQALVVSILNLHSSADHYGSHNIVNGNTGSIGRHVTDQENDCLTASKSMTAFFSCGRYLPQ